MTNTPLGLPSFSDSSRYFVAVAVAALLVHCGSPQGADVPNASADAMADAQDTSFDAPADVSTTNDVPSNVDAVSLMDVRSNVDVPPLMDVPSDGFRDGYSVLCLALGGTCVVGTASIATGPIFGDRCPPGTVAYNSGDEGVGQPWELFENRHGAGCGLAPGGIVPTPIVCCIPAR